MHKVYLPSLESTNITINARIKTIHLFTLIIRLVVDGKYM